jgi:hypothetical protein
MRRVLSLGAFYLAAFSAQAAAPVSFNRDIRPIMSDTCFRCHGPDKSSRMAGMRLDLRAEALKPTQTGVIPIVPGKPDESGIIQRIFATSTAKIMPPQYIHKELSATQKETIRRWVEEGAKYEGHWAFEPVKRPAAPEVTGSKLPIRNPIDAFIQARLVREGLQGSPEADRRTLIRRVTLDLNGLPPTPEEVQAFVRDESPDAYEKLVDRLLASPRYAEKQALLWLDAVRYADTTGFHGDTPYPAWPYRDWVLRAFRDNKPYDVFAREQLAGDLLPNATIDQKIASAYNRINRNSAEGGLQPKEYLAKYASDRVRTTSAVWLGATLGCAECHDHKFDPFLSKDFYSMKAFFADIDETGLIPANGPNAFGSKLLLPTPEQTRRLEQLESEIRDAEWDLGDQTRALAPQRAAWEKRTLAAYDKGDLAWHYQRPLSATAAHGAKLTIYNEEPVDSNFAGGATLTSEHKPGAGLIIASGPNPDNETYTVTFRPGQGSWTALGIEVQQDESLPGVRLARGSDRFVLTEVDAEVGDGHSRPRKLSFVLATGDGFGQPPHLPALAAIDGDPKTGWGFMYGEGHNPFLALRFSERVPTTPDSVITVRLHHDSEFRRAVIGRFRLALSSAENSWPEMGESAAKMKARKSETEPNTITLSIPTEQGLPPKTLEALRKPADQRDVSDEQAIRNYFEWSSPALQQQVIRLAKLMAERGAIEAAVNRVVITESTQPRETRILPRGNWMDDSGQIVEPAIPVVFGKLDTGGRIATRLDLANWIVSPTNPLTARLFANRMWRQFFGIGITKSLDDLGSQGEWPVNIELLDWLAAEFMQPSWQAEGRHPWDVKHLLRTIVLSHTYRQSSMSNPTLDERDADNRLLARQSRFRVDAETIHDIALSVSGLLVERFGGPSVKPYQPDGYLAALNFPKREYSAGHGEDLYRRGIYTFWQRTFLHPSLMAFDAPTREECTVNRVNSNTPLQAVVLLNDPIYVEAARVFAQNILQKGGHGVDHQLNWAFERALSREPSAEERRILLDLHRESLEKFRESPENAKEFVSVGEAPVSSAKNPAQLAAMENVARAILNLHETITRN